MGSVDNNQFEVKPNLTSKRKRVIPCSNVFLNPALDLLANEDPMCNNAMEITPNKKRKRAKSCDIAAFENTALDLGISKAAVNEFLLRELDNVRRNVRTYESPIKLNPDPPKVDESEPIYANLSDISNVPSQNINTEESNTSNVNVNIELSELDCNSKDELDSGISVLEPKSLNKAISNDFDPDLSAINNITSIHSSVTNQIIVNNTSNLNLSFIDRLALDSPCISNQSLFLDDDLNESNIMEIKTITIVTKKKCVQPKTITNPFLDPNLDTNVQIDGENPFLIDEIYQPELEHNVETMQRQIANHVTATNNLIPRKLFASDTNSTISTVNESMNVDSHEYENLDSYRSESPIYENIDEETVNDNFNKQSKILGCDVSRFSAVDIMNLNKNSQINSSNDSNDSRKDLKHQIFKAGNKLSKKVFKSLKKTFKSEKIQQNATLNPYEVPRKTPKQKTVVKEESGIENPALRLDNSDEIEIEEVDDDENQYETIKTLRNTHLNMNVTPLREMVNDIADVSNNRSNTPGKKVRFDSTLNQEKIITGDSFDFDVQSPGFDAKIDKYHDELENCINEKKFLQQNM